MSMTPAHVITSTPSPSAATAHSRKPNDVQSNIITSFQACGDAFNQFDYLLQLASEMDELPDCEKRPDALVEGCQSQVWLYLSWEGEGEGAKLHLRGDSDTLMVRGVIRILVLMFCDHTPREVLECPIRFVEETELASIFDAKRKTGVSSIVSVIQASAHAQLKDSSHTATMQNGGPSAPTLKSQLEAADARAQRIIEELKRPDTSQDDFERLVTEFVQCKFFLTPEECTTDNLLELAEISVEKLLRVNDRSVRLAQGSTTCTNQSSTDIKKVLLSLTLQRALGVSFTPEESANLETVDELAHALFAGRQRAGRTDACA